MTFRLFDLKPCQAPSWARGGHGQTLWNFCLPNLNVEIQHEKILLSLPDKDQLALLYTEGCSDIVVYLFHGLSGGATSDYMMRMAQIAIARGHSVYRVNHRGCGDGVGLARLPYHSGRGDDISEVLAYGRLKHPKKQHIAIGFSLSGNALLTLLTGLKGSVLPDAAISVNAPIDLAAASDKLKLGLNRLYDWYFVGRLRRAIAAQYQHGHLVDKVIVPRLSTLRQLDSLYTAPQCGFESAEDYYQQCSTHPYLSQITIPTILLTAHDDPFIPVESYLSAQLSATTQLHIEPSGGHLGYLSRTKTPLGSYRWLDYALCQCLQELTDEQF